MKIVVIILNVLFGLIFLLTTASSQNRWEYADVMLEGPVFFCNLICNLILVISVSVGPSIIIYALLKEFTNSNSKVFLAVLLAIFGLLSIGMGYYTLPSVRQERLKTHSIVIKNRIEDLEFNRDDYHENRDREYYNFRMNELKMFYTMIQAQLRFLKSAKHFKNPRADNLPIFFGALAALLFINACWFAFCSKEEAE